MYIGRCDEGEAETSKWLRRGRMRLILMMCTRDHRGSILLKIRKKLDSFVLLSIQKIVKKQQRNNSK